MSFTPNFVLADRSTTAAFMALGGGGAGGIRQVTFEALASGAWGRFYLSPDRGG